MIATIQSHRPDLFLEFSGGTPISPTLPQESQAIKLDPMYQYLMHPLPWQQNSEMWWVMELPMGTRVYPQEQNVMTRVEYGMELGNG